MIEYTVFESFTLDGQRTEREIVTNQATRKGAELNELSRSRYLGRSSEFSDVRVWIEETTVVQVYHATAAGRRKARAELDVAIFNDEVKVEDFALLERWGTWKRAGGVRVPAGSETAILAAAYEASNNYETSWKEGERSTSIGDLLVLENGSRFIVRRLGFELVHFGDTVTAS